MQEGNRLLINARIDGGGSFRAEVRDAAGNVFHGPELDGSVPGAGDSVAHPVRWKDASLQEVYGYGGREYRDNGDNSDLKKCFLPFNMTKLVMNKKNLTEYSDQTKQTGSTRFHGWKLGEAKAKFSRVVRLAASGQPQRVTVRGKDTVVIVAAEEFDRLRARAAADSLHELLSRSPLNRLDFDDEGLRSPVREVEL